MKIVMDIGGTRMRIAGVRDPEAFGEPVILDTPPSYEGGLSAIEAVVKKTAKGEPVEAIAAAVPGILSKDRRSIVRAVNVQRWDRHAFADDLERVCGGTAYLTNDTEQVGLGEAHYGAGKGVAIVVYITISTGVNGVRIVDGKADRSAQGFEIGGQYLFAGGERRTLEELISGRAIQKKYGVHPVQLGKDSPVWEELAAIAAYGVHNTILHWSPERVVIGGAICNPIGISVERVRTHVKEVMKKFPEIPDIVHSSLGDVGGLWGGLEVLKRNS